jgi:hypothetical protein
MRERSSRTIRRSIVAGRLTIAASALLAVFALPLAVARAQTATTAQNSDVAQPLPNAPEVASSGVSSSVAAAPVEPHRLMASGAASGTIAVAPVETIPVASPTQKYIKPGQVVPALTASDKVLLGVRNSFTPFAAAGWFASSGYEQLLNNSPNYGTDRGAFGQRLGAAAVRDSTESIFGDSVMANFFHEDPRYYQMGPGHNFFIRVVYAGTRPLLTRTDSGRATPNLALLSGTLGGAALTNVYYPQVNRGMGQTMETFGGSLGGAALSNVVSEFYDGFRHTLHIGHTR